MKYIVRFFVILLITFCITILKAEETKSIVYINDGYPDVPRYTLSLNEILKSKKIILLVSNTEKYKLINTKRSKKELLPIDYLIQKAMHKLNLVVLENK